MAWKIIWKLFHQHWKTASEIYEQAFMVLFNHVFEKLMLILALESLSCCKKLYILDIVALIWLLTKNPNQPKKPQTHKKQNPLTLAAFFIYWRHKSQQLTFESHLNSNRKYTLQTDSPLMQWILHSEKTSKCTSKSIYGTLG